MRAAAAKVLAGRPEVARVATIELDRVTVALVQPVEGGSLSARELKAGLPDSVLVGVVADLPPADCGVDALLRLPFRVGLAVPYELD